MIVKIHNFLINLKIFQIKYLIFKKARLLKKNLSFKQILTKQLLTLEINKIYLFKVNQNQNKYKKMNKLSRNLKD